MLRPGTSAGRPAAVTRSDRHLPPADPARERPIVEYEPLPFTGSAVHDVEAERLEPPGARSCAARCRRRRGARAGRRESAPAARASRPRNRAFGRPGELIRGDLGDVERVPQIDLAAGDLDPGIAVIVKLPSGCAAAVAGSRGNCHRAGLRAKTIDAAPHARYSHGAPVGSMGAGAKTGPRVCRMLLPLRVVEARPADPPCTGTNAGASGRRRSHRHPAGASSP